MSFAKIQESGLWNNLRNITLVKTKIGQISNNQLTNPTVSEKLKKCISEKKDSDKNITVLLIIVKNKGTFCDILT